MNFNEHLELAGKHSRLSPSNNSWVNYDAETLIQRRIGEIRKYMDSVLNSSDLNAVFVMLTDILNESTELLFVGGEADKIIADAFRMPVAAESYILDGVVSRKKQLIPPIMESLQE